MEREMNISSYYFCSIDVTYYSVRDILSILLIFINFLFVNNNNLFFFFLKTSWNFHNWLFQRYDLDLSLFERMVMAREREFGREGAMKNGSLVTLSTQRRMRPEIANLIRIPLYPNLLDAEEVKHYPDVKGIQETEMERERERER